MYYIAFAELQTDMTEITSDLSSGQTSIPFRDYRSFCMKVLFPNVAEEEHPVVRGVEVSTNTLALTILYRVQFFSMKFELCDSEGKMINNLYLQF